MIACAGDILTSEGLAAVAILREHCPDLKIRFINVVDLFRLMPEREHPHGMSDREFDGLFTKSKPVIFNFHAYASLIHKLPYRPISHNLRPEESWACGQLKVRKTASVQQLLSLERPAILSPGTL